MIRYFFSSRARPAYRFSVMLLIAVGGCLMQRAALSEDAASEPAKYLGVVTCSGSTCHGAPHPLVDSKVNQNEFITWHRDDAHAKAYRVLLEEKGQRIAHNLGLDNAATASECLNCHANNAPEAQRGKRFQIADGVSCETCHGPASKWLGTHVTGEASRADNLKVGMYPTEEPAARAKLCLACHLGAENKFATHRIMGAGHPRLSFELDTFTVLQPAHFRTDADYRSRKRVASHVETWAVGQSAAAARTLELFISQKGQGAGGLPEFAFFDCHACHHPLTELRWAPRASAGLPPGVPHFNDANLLMLIYLMRATDAQLADELHAGLLALHKASLESADAARTAARSVQATLGKIDSKIRGHAFTADETRGILTSIVRGGRDGEYRDYAAAEQAVMGAHALVDSLPASGGDAAKTAQLNAQIKTLYAVLKDENAYQPARFSAEMKTFEAALQ